MKAAVIYQHGGTGSIQYETYFADPVAAPDEVVVKVHAATLNYHDIFTRNGIPSITVPMPVIMGLDFAGEIVEVGREVTEWRVGDRVRVMIDSSDRKTFGSVIARPAMAVWQNIARCRPIIGWRSLTTSVMTPPTARPGA